MKNRIHTPLVAMIALGAAFAAPAFAQQQMQQSTQQDMQDAAMREHQQIENDAAASSAGTSMQTQSAQTMGQQAQSPAQPATGAATQEAQQATGAGGQKQQGWNDLDADKDGAISKTESAGNPGLSQVFDQADSNADGKLTTDEYKAFVVKNYGAGAGESSSGQ